ncbi:MAG: DUF3267 domain-containing protein [Clostridia bacterium]|nr:DUF3267 domain-containing protein [Clostridia bacterium]
MKTQITLPENYTKLLDIDLQKNKKLALLVNLLGLAIIAVMVVAAHIFNPVSMIFDMSEGLGVYFARFAVIAIGAVAYILLHEIVHGICMKHFSGMKPTYGFTGLYAYAGSKAYFNKRDYIIITLAPIVVWGIVLAVINVFVHESWFWVVYFIQIINVSGAAGDIYVTVKFSKLPPDILVNDTGVAMTVYTKENEVKQ